MGSVFSSIGNRQLFSYACNSFGEFHTPFDDEPTCARTASRSFEWSCNRLRVLLFAASAVTRLPFLLRFLLLPAVRGCQGHLVSWRIPARRSHATSPSRWSVTRRRKARRSRRSDLASSSTSPRWAAASHVQYVFTCPLRSAAEAKANFLAGNRVHGPNGQGLVVATGVVPIRLLVVALGRVLHPVRRREQRRCRRCERDLRRCVTSSAVRTERTATSTTPLPLRTPN
jgi:hypothetical protein